MTGRPLLNADMRTIGQWLRQGLHWWIDELRGLVPPRLRRNPAAGAPPYVVRAGRLAPPPGRGLPAVPRPGRAITLVVPAADCLTRTVTRPTIGERDLRRMMAFEADALLPMPSGSALLAMRMLGPADEAGKSRIEVAALPIALGQKFLGVAQQARVTPQAVIVEGDPAGLPPLDFAPAMRDAGLLDAKRSATPLLWAIVGLAFLLNIWAAIWRDSARVAQLERIVAEQQPAIGIAQAITRRAEQDRRLVTRTLRLRHADDPLRLLAVVNRTLPEGIWLQRFVWDGETVRLTGYRPERADVATALRRSGHFAGVHAMGDETQAVLPTGQPFDIAARVVLR